MGEETRKVQDAITRIKLAAQSALNVNREFTAGRVKLALDKKDAN